MRIPGMDFTGLITMQIITTSMIMMVIMVIGMVLIGAVRTQAVRIGAVAPTGLVNGPIPAHLQPLARLTEGALGSPVIAQ